MDAKVYELINDQINKELHSAYLYLSFADYYEEEGLSGYANYFEIQAQEERDHAMIFRNYLHENGEAVKLLAIDMPDKTFANFLEPLEAAMEHEKYVTSLINDIYAAAAEVKDYRTMKFLDWFNTQVPDLVSQGLVVAATTEAAKTPAAWSEFFSNQDIMAEFKKANDNMASFSYIPGFSAVGSAMNETAAKAATGDAKVSDIFDTAQTTSVEALKNAKLPVKE